MIHYSKLKAEEKYDMGMYTTYYGRAQAVIYAEKEGKISIKVSGHDLYGETMVIVKRIETAIR